MNKKPLIIGVAGGTGSGKTTLVNAIIKCLDPKSVVTIQHDNYYKDRSNLPSSEREKINYDHPDALENNLLVGNLKELVEGRKVEIPVYNFTTHTRKRNGNLVSPAKAIIVEGVLIFNDNELRGLLGIKIFVNTDDDIRFIRRLQRDTKERGRSIESVIKQYVETVRPMHIEFVKPSRRYADIIVPEGHNPVAIDMIVSMIKDKILG